MDNKKINQQNNLENDDPIDTQLEKQKKEVGKKSAFPPLIITLIIIAISFAHGIKVATDWQWSFGYYFWQSIIFVALIGSFGVGFTWIIYGATRKYSTKYIEQNKKNNEIKNETLNSQNTYQETNNVQVSRKNGMPGIMIAALIFTVICSFITVYYKIQMQRPGEKMGIIFGALFAFPLFVTAIILSITSVVVACKGRQLKMWSNENSQAFVVTAIISLVISIYQTIVLISA